MLKSPGALADCEKWCQLVGMSEFFSRWTWLFQFLETATEELFSPSYYRSGTRGDIYMFAQTQA